MTRIATIAALLSELEQNHEQMAVLAERLDWDQFIPLWQRALPRFDELRSYRLEALPGKERQQAYDCLHHLLTCQNQVIGHIVPWMEQIRPLLQSFRGHPMEASAENNPQP